MKETINNAMSAQQEGCQKEKGLIDGMTEFHIVIACFERVFTCFLIVLMLRANCVLNLHGDRTWARYPEISNVSAALARGALTAQDWDIGVRSIQIWQVQMSGGFVFFSISGL